MKDKFLAMFFMRNLNKNTQKQKKYCLEAFDR